MGDDLKRLAVLTSGGDSPGMNAAIRAVVRAGCFHGLEVFGIERGYTGLLNDTIVSLDARAVSGIIGRGGTILRSARCEEFYKPAGRARAAETLRAREIDALVVIGGDGSYRGAQLLHGEHGIRVAGLPGTIDNDIGGTDFTIGFDTALNTAMEAIDRLRDTADSHDRVFFVEVMGRNSGSLALASALAGGADDVLVPETPTDLDALVAQLELARTRGKSSSIVVVAEGDEAGSAHEIAALVRARSEIDDARVTVIGHLQRGGSPTANDRILASRLGVGAVKALIEGKSSFAAGMRNRQVIFYELEESWSSKDASDSPYLHISEILRT